MKSKSGAKPAELASETIRGFSFSSSIMSAIRFDPTPLIVLVRELA